MIRSLMLFPMLALAACGSEAPAPAEEAPKEAPAPAPAAEKGAKPGKAQVVDCNATAQTLQGKVGGKVAVKCPAGCTTGSVWGDLRYTPDTKICTAAIHSGALTDAGGKAMVMFKGKMGDFKGTKKNGIESRAWSTEYEPTVVFKSKKK